MAINHRSFPCILPVSREYFLRISRRKESPNNRRCCASMKKQPRWHLCRAGSCAAPRGGSHIPHRQTAEPLLIHCEIGENLGAWFESCRHLIEKQIPAFRIHFAQVEYATRQRRHRWMPSNHNRFCHFMPSHLRRLSAGIATRLCAIWVTPRGADKPGWFVRSRQFIWLRYLIIL